MAHKGKRKPFGKKSRPSRTKTTKRGSTKPPRSKKKAY